MLIICWKWTHSGKIRFKCLWFVIKFTEHSLKSFLSNTNRHESNTVGHLCTTIHFTSIWYFYRSRFVKKLNCKIPLEPAWIRDIGQAFVFQRIIFCSTHVISISWKKLFFFHTKKYPNGNPRRIQGSKTNWENPAMKL